jgi:acyl dehydratase
MPYLEDHEPGHAMITASRRLVAEDVIAFSELSGDWLPIHSDAEFAKQSVFGKIVAQGTLVLTVAHGLLVRSGIFDGSTAFLGLTWKMNEPVCPGDTLHVEIVIKSRRKSRSKPTRGIVEFDFGVINQHGAKVGKGTWTQQFGKRPAMVRNIESSNES